MVCESPYSCREPWTKAHRGSNVGAGLLANAECQSPKILTGPPLSRASPLPHFERLWVRCSGATGPNLSVAAPQTTGCTRG
ncbi:hypothetical protein DA482_24400 [Pseudomonas fluorescens]|nr:hypothetical protein D0N73_01700 [Pseudomonas fluorescens]TWR45072.1 hypothetical protein FIP59_21840 [Pseudomonas fluorescens]